MRKFLILFFSLIYAHGVAAFADPIVELAAPRNTANSIIQESTSETKSKAIIEQEKKTSAKATSKKTVKQTKKHIKKKHAQVKTDYNKVSKLIEYGYYDEADKILNGAISRNSKDIKALALRTVSLAKQTKLDPAQEELDSLLKKYPNNSDLHYAQGVVYYQRTTSSNMYYRTNTQNLVKNSMKEFKKAIELDKTNARALNAAGVISLNTQDKKAAEDYFKKALMADKNYALAIDNLGVIDFINGKYAEAEKKFKQALDINTQNTTAMYHLAQTSIQKQDYKTALIYLNNALSLNANSPAIYNLMGKCYTAQGNEATAINSFKKSIEVKPEFTLSYLDLAQIYQDRGDGEFAIEQLRTALSINPEYYDAKIKIADISYANGKYNQAIAVYSELVGVEGYNEAALKGLSNSYFANAQLAANKSIIGSNKDIFKALESINRAISANPQDLELHLAKLKLSKITNQNELSQKELENIIKSPSNTLINKIVKGEAYMALGQFKNAQKEFNEATNLSSNTEDDLYIAEIFIYNKQLDIAQKVLSKVLSSDSKNQQALSNMDYILKSKKYADNYYTTAKSCLKKKNTQLAIEYLSRSLSINPNNPSAILLIAQLYEKQKDYPSAVSNYKTFLGINPNVSNAKEIERKIKALENRL